MKILFDLDYTLMDSERLHRKLAKIFDRENYEADYQKHFKDKGISFDGEKYLEILKQDGRIDGEREKELRDDLEEIFANLDEYLKPDAENVLKHFKQAGDELVLITFGNKTWQEKKVNSLGIKKYFDRIIFEDQNKSKSEYLMSLGEEREKVLIINDNLSEAVEMKKILGDRAELKLVKGKYNETAQPDIENLSELIPERNRESGREINLK